jgi:hypothetical protein
MPRKNTNSVQVPSRWFTNGVVVPSISRWGSYTLGLMLSCLPPFLVNAGFIMNHFYATGAYLDDSGMLADLAWHNGIELTMPRVSGGESHLGIHVSLILVLSSWLSYCLPLGRVTYFALFEGASFGLLGFAVFFAFTRLYQQSLVLSPVLAGLLGGAVALSGVAYAMTGYPHIVQLIPAFALLFLTNLFSERIKAAIVCFVLCLLVREDAGFHLVAILGLVGLTNLLRGQTWRAQKLLIAFLSIAFAYSVTVILLQKQFFPSYDVLWRHYTGHSMFTHVTAELLWQRLRFYVVERGYIVLPFLITLSWAICTRNPYLPLGYLAYMPWLVLHWLAVEDAPGTLFAFYASPFLVSLSWPLLALRLHDERHAVLARDQEVLLGMAALIGATTVATFVKLDNHLVVGQLVVILLPVVVLAVLVGRPMRPSVRPLVRFALVVVVAWGGLGPFLFRGWRDIATRAWPQPATVTWRRTEAVLDRLTTALPDLGDVVVDAGVASLRPRDFALHQLLQPHMQRQIDTLAFFPASLQSSDALELATAADLSIVYTAPGSNLIIARRRPLDGVSQLGEALQAGSLFLRMLRSTGRTVWVNGHWHIPAGVQGIALFGPYLSLLPGQYECAYAVLAETSPEASTLLIGIDVVHDAGRQLLGTQELTPSDLVKRGSNQWAVLPFELPKAVKDVECRLWAKGVALSVTDVMLHKHN